jgi:hypothetical protein
MERKAAQQATPSPQTSHLSQAPDLIEQLKKLAGRPLVEVDYTRRAPGVGMRFVSQPLGRQQFV